MKITCHSCGAKYTVSDDKIQGKTVKMKCRKCSATIVVGNAQADGASAAADAGDAGSPPPGSFLVNVADGDQRTMTAAEIADAYRGGTITDDTYVWADGMADWQTVLENAEIAPLIQGGGAPAAAPSFQGVPDFDAAPAASPEPARAARKEPKASRDLFGEAPAAAASSGGLFGSSSSASKSSSGGGGLTSEASGKRDENSVLFSLSALTSVEASAPAGKTTAKKDDSGLIDLKALAASAPAASPMSPLSTDNLGISDHGAVFPLGMPILAPPPQAAPAVGMDVAAAPPQKSKVGIIVGGAVAIVAMVLVFFLVKGNPPPPPAPTPATAAAPAPTAAEPTPPPTAEAAPEPSASASASAAPVAKGPPGKWPPKGKATSAPGSTPPATGGGDAPKPPPPKSKCGCAASDLMCNMKCSAGK
jgi:predicted Zn finger-like uncharacterized protein